MDTVLGPTNVVAAEHAVSLHCVTHLNDVCCQHHVAFTNSERSIECSGLPDVKPLTVFCDPLDTLESSTVVGVIAGKPMMHANHAHCTVYVSGAVTIACLLEDVADLPPMTPISCDMTQKHAMQIRGSRLTVPRIVAWSFGDPGRPFALLLAQL